MRSMLGGKVIEGKQHFFILLQAYASFWDFGFVTENELIVGSESCFSHRPRESVATLFLLFFDGSVQKLPLPAPEATFAWHRGFAASWEAAHLYGVLGCISTRF